MEAYLAQIGRDLERGQVPFMVRALRGGALKLDPNNVDVSFGANMTLMKYDALMMLADAACELASNVAMCRQQPEGVIPPWQRDRLPHSPSWQPPETCASPPPLASSAAGAPWQSEVRAAPWLTESASPLLQSR